MLHAVDTNILARALTDDGSEHAIASSTFVRDNEVFVPDTVLVETEWLLRSRLKVPRHLVESLFGTLLSWPNIVFADRSRATRAVIAFKNGLDFADAMHLFLSERCASMITYDADFIRRSGEVSDTIPVRTP